MSEKGEDYKSEMDEEGYSEDSNVEDRDGQPEEDEDEDDKPYEEDDMEMIIQKMTTLKMIMVVKKIVMKI